MSAPDGRDAGGAGAPEDGAGTGERGAGGEDPGAGGGEQGAHPDPGGGVAARVPVVAAVIRRDGRYLLGRRPEAKRHGGLWEFPGGKLHDGEDVAAAVRRELREELELECRGTGALLWSARDPGSPFVIDFVEVEAGGRPRPLEHSEVGWFTLDELGPMALAPTDAAFVAHLAAHGHGGSGDPSAP